MIMYKPFCRTNITPTTFGLIGKVGAQKTKFSLQNILKVSISTYIKNFFDAICHNVTDIDISDVNFDNEHEIRKIEVNLKSDRIYKFVKSMKSLPSHESFVANSFEWRGVSSAVEVYMLPQNTILPNELPYDRGYSFPQFFIRRMNNLHRHRVLTTLKRLWYVPNDENSFSHENVVWAGASGCGVTVAVNEIILESILKLQELGIQNSETTNQFFLLERSNIFRYFFNPHSKKVDIEQVNDDIICNREDIRLYFKRAYIRNRNSFVIHKRYETDIDLEIEMPQLMVVSCDNLSTKMNTTWKSSKTFYLYDHVNSFEFNTFIDICFAFDRKTCFSKSRLLERFAYRGGSLRNIFSLNGPQGQRHLDFDTLDEINNCEPIALKSTRLETLIDVTFQIPTSFEDNENFRMNKIALLNSPFYDIDNAYFEFCHKYYNWCVNLLSDNVALNFGRVMRIQLNEEYKNNTLLQVQKTVNIYSGILRKPLEHYKLPVHFYMSCWDFFSCFKPTLPLLSPTNEIFLSSKILKDCAKNNLIDMMPPTSNILNFYGQYLRKPFHTLSNSYVYRSSAKSNPVFHALTADPDAHRLFLFQSTLDRPSNHPICISTFNKIISNLVIDESDTINEIYFYLIISPLLEIENEKFFSFKLGALHLNSCLLTHYSSVCGRNALKKAIDVQNVNRCKRELTSQDEIKIFNNDELNLMKTIPGFYSNVNSVENFSKFTMSQADFDNLFEFLDLSSRMKPYICSASFTAN